MAGHSKWSQIKRKKAVTDQRRAAAWTKLIREITVAAKAGGGDPDGNPRLRLAVDNARAANMPNDNIDRAIKKGTGELEGVEYQESPTRHTGRAASRSTSRGSPTISTARSPTSATRSPRPGGNLGQTGSVAWMFDHRGQIVFDASRYDEASLLEAVLEAGGGGHGERRGIVHRLYGDRRFPAVKDALRVAGFEWESSELAMVPKTTMKVEGTDAPKLVKLLDMLEDLDDVQKVFTNADIDEDSLVGAG
jgi:transcriptional/translational regulatory protein YebC/TACO1